MSIKHTFTAKLIQVEPPLPPEPIPPVPQDTLAHPPTKAEIKAAKAKADKAKRLYTAYEAACAWMSHKMLEAMSETTEDDDRRRAIRKAAETMFGYSITYDAFTAMAAFQGWSVDSSWVQVARIAPTSTSTHKGWMAKEKWYLVSMHAIADFYDVHATTRKNLKPPYIDIVFCGPADNVKHAGQDFVESVNAGFSSSQARTRLAADFWLGFCYGLETSYRQKKGRWSYQSNLESLTPLPPAQLTEPPTSYPMSSGCERNLDPVSPFTSKAPTGEADAQQADPSPGQTAHASPRQDDLADDTLLSHIAVFRHSYNHPPRPEHDTDGSFAAAMDSAEQLITTYTRTRGMHFPVGVTRQAKLKKWDAYCDGLMRGKKVLEDRMRARGAQA